MTNRTIAHRLVTLLAWSLILLAFSPTDGLSTAGAAPGKPPRNNDTASHGASVTLTPPINDNFANATIVSAVPFVVTGLDTVDATTQANDPETPCGSPGIPQQSHSVWYSFTPSITDDYNINTVGSNYDTVLAVWTGSWGALINQDCNDDSSGNFTSSMNVTLYSGTTYYIEAMAYGNNLGDLLNLAVDDLPPPPPNDDFNDALVITGVSYSDSENTITATTAADDPSFDCGSYFSGQGAHSIWYSVSSPYERILTADTLGSPSDIDTVLGIFTGSRGALTLVACNDDAGGTLQSQAQLALQAGTLYHVEIVGYDEEEAGQLDFSATLTDTPTPTPTPVPPPEAPVIAIAQLDDDLRLSWTHLSANSSYEVWRSSSQPYFQPGDGSSVKVADVPAPSGGAEAGYTAAGAWADANHYYYLVRGVNAIQQVSPNSNRAGKFVRTLAPGWNLVTWPLLVADTSLDGSLGAQLYGTESPDTADRVLAWNGASQSYTSAWFCAGPVCQSWGQSYYQHWLANDYSPSPLAPPANSGYWIQNRSGVAETLVILGQVAEADRSVPVGQTWQMLGSAFPTSLALDAANLPATGTESPETADRVLYWNEATQSYQSAWFCGGATCQSWGQSYYNHWLMNDYSPTDIVLEPGHGFWYQNRHTPFTWTNSLGAAK